MCIVVAGVLFILTWPVRRSDQLRALLARIRSADAVLRSGSYDWRFGGDEEFREFDALLDAAVHNGLPLVSGLRALRVAMTAAQELTKKGQATRVLFWARMVLGLGLALGIRLIITEDLFSTIEIATAVVSALPAAVAVATLTRLIPRPWQLGPHGQIVAQVYAWTGAYVSGESFETLPELALLTERELLRGVSLLEEKRDLLVTWSADRITAGEQRLRRLEDWLPLFELFGIGLPMLVLMAKPVVAMAERY